jgi:4,5-DOPA dioxygenase extradiol
MSPSKRMPTLFVGHGSPMNALEDNEFTRSWQQLARQMPRPQAILCVSAHWETRGVYVGATAQPETIHDFYGFPKALFDVSYPAPGDPALAQRIKQLITTSKVHLDQGRGLDHGVWSVLRIMYPQADVPTLQLSLDMTQPGAFHVRLAQELGPLRDEGVLILGSGNIVHNLREMSFRDLTPLPWAENADAIVRARIEAGDFAALADWNALGADVVRGIAGPEHFLPLVYVVTQRRADEAISFFNATVLGSISMTGVRVG